MSRTRQRTFTDEQLLCGQINQVSKDQPLCPAEAGVLLGLSAEALRTRRRDGKPPPFRQEGGPGSNIFYRLGDVLIARNGSIFQSTQASHQAHRENMLRYSSFAHWLDGASSDAEWAFCRVGKARRPAEFFHALRTVPTSQRHGIAWHTLSSFLMALVAAEPAPSRAARDTANEYMTASASPVLPTMVELALPRASNMVDQAALNDAVHRQLPKSFTAFLSSDDRGDEWLFILRGITGLPVDYFESAGHGHARAPNEKLAWLSRGAWINAMQVALSHEAERQRAARRLAELDAREASSAKSSH